MTVVEISLPEAKRLVDKANKALASNDSISGHDLALLRSAMDTWWTVADELLENKMSLKRLRDLFGVVPPKSNELTPEPKPDESSSDNVQDESDDNRKDGDRGEDPPAKGHGHGGKRAAKKTPVTSEHHHIASDQPAGTACSEPGCTGKVYEFKHDGELRSQLRVVGGSALRAEKHVFHDMRCNMCGTVYPAPADANFLEDGPVGKMYGHSAVATVALYKYLGGTPWYRQSALQHGLGFDVSPSTQWDLCEELANAGLALCKYLITRAASGWLFYADDVSFPILSEDKELKPRRSTGKLVEREGCHTSCVIAELEDDRRLVLFKTGIIHAGEWMDEILKNRSSSQGPPMHMSDRSSSNPVTVCPVIELGCNAHLRNKFDGVRKNFRLACGKMLDLYKKIYKINKASLDMPPPERLRHLQEHAGPLMDKIFQTAHSEIDHHYTEPNSTLGHVYQYAIYHEESLRGFLKYERAPLDNNICESMLARVVVLRKNAWFYKNMVGAWVSDVIMSLGHSAVLAGANPYDYFLQILRHQDYLRDHPEQFLPWNYKETAAGLVNARTS